MADAVEPSRASAGGRVEGNEVARLGSARAQENRRRGQNHRVRAQEDGQGGE
jgi:hypothetical protein